MRRLGIAASAVALVLLTNPAWLPEAEAADGHGRSQPMMQHGHMQMMQQQMGRGTGPMMQQGQGPMQQGRMGLGLGRRAVPIKHLSTEEVRHFMEHRIHAQGFTGLQVGNVEVVDDTITVEIVTPDGTVVQRMEVDRHTGAIAPIT